MAPESQSPEAHGVTIAQLELAEAAAYRDLHRAAPEVLAAEHGIEVGEIAGAVCQLVRSLPASRMLNHVVGLGLTELATEDALDAIRDLYGGEVAHSIGLAPAAEPPDLGARLLRRGYRDDYAWVKFARPAERVVGRGTDLELVEASGGLALGFGEIVVRGFDLPVAFARWLAEVPGLPGWRCLVALEGGRPVAAGALRIEGPVGWLGFAATLPEHRGRGAQSALLATRITLAAEAGALVVATETGARVAGRPDRSYRNIERSGFKELYTRPNLTVR